MPSTVTVTAKTGPDIANETNVLTGVSSFTVDCDKKVLTVNQGGVYKDFDLAATNVTLTATITGVGTNYAIVVSATN